jgi:Phytanoyl-CoA dioxygenase (PhyH)
MLERKHLLSTRQVARFVARGFLRFDALVPVDVNQAFLADFEAGLAEPKPAGTPLSDCYAPGSALARLVELGPVRGIIESLLGPAPVFDHQYCHVKRGPDQRSQDLHQDSTIDPRIEFDLQLLYFPQAVSADMGGTRFLPGSHLRLVHESSIARYQNVVGQEHVVCPAGSLFVFHHGLWHGAGCSRSSQCRILFKLRLNPSVPQHRHWNTDDLDERALAAQPIFVPGRHDPEDIQTILCTSEAWFENDTQRLEYINRIRLWRYLLGDARADAHYWLSRVENRPGTQKLASASSA